LPPACSSVRGRVEFIGWTLFKSGSTDNNFVI
jgi:hypothetical protein